MNAPFLMGVLAAWSAAHLGLAQLGWAGVPFVACGLAILFLARTSVPAAGMGRVEPQENTR